MDPVDKYFEYLDEDFDFVNKVFKASLIKNILQKIKTSVKGNQVNIPAIKAALKPIPSMSQDKINKFLDKYVPNYTPNYNTAKKYFDVKFPTGKNNDVLAGFTAASTAIDKKRTLKDNIKKIDRIYRSDLGSSPAGAGFVILLAGITVAMTAFSVPELFDSIVTQGLAVLVGILLMLSGIVTAMRG